jgi:ATP phosphoribosyltransferase regulatory subunit
LVGKIVINFSPASDAGYYSGIVFKGYINGIPQSVLSGGQYDLLMKRMGRKSGAVGFAVYLDLVDTKEEVSEYDADVLILYNDKDEITELLRKADALRKDGKSVCLANNKPVGKCYREVIGENR